MLFRVRILNRIVRQVHTANFVIAKATNYDRREISRLMQEIFYKTDPSSIYSKVSEIPNVSAPIQEMTLDSLDENVSFVAKSKEREPKIVGTAINGIRPVVINSAYMEKTLKQVNSKSEKTLLELWQFVSSMPPDSKKYFGTTDSVFEIRYLVVEPSFRNRGVATALVNYSKKEAASLGHKFIRIDCTNHFTARIASALGMDCIYEMNYEDYRNPSGEHVFQNVVYPHTKILVYAGKSVT